MEWTLDQTLQKGVDAHKAGEVQEADRLYTAILQAQPKHPDANHNMGVLAVGVGKIQEALPFFKVALDANSSIGQFWLSYIDALIKLDRIAEAQAVFDQAKDKGANGEAFNHLEQRLCELSSNIQAPPSDQLQSITKLFTQGYLQKALSATIEMLERFPYSAALYNIAGASNAGLMEFDAAIDCYNRALKFTPDSAEIYYNMGIALNNKGDPDEAIESYKQAIKIKPDYTEAYNNMGNVLQHTGDPKAALYCYKQSIKINHSDAEVYNNMGSALQDNGDPGAAIDSYKQALKIKPDYAEAYSNMGNTLKSEGDLKAAEESYRQAIALKPDYAPAYSSLSMTLKDKGDLGKALTICKKSIVLNAKSSESYLNMGIILNAIGDVDSALESIEKAIHIDPKSKASRLLLAVLKSKKVREKIKISVDNISAPGRGLGLISNPFILSRVVEPELITNLYEIYSRELDQMKGSDARYGNGRCSPDFNLFKDDRSIIKTLEEDLMRIMMHAVKSDVYVFDSFFNILGTGGGTTPHCHLTSLDKENGLDLGNQKYSLVYYLSVGDQNCSEPGILKLYGPSQDILPSDGMIAIMPAGRLHSAVYGGKKDRVMIGVNFYSL